MRKIIFVLLLLLIGSPASAQTAVPFATYMAARPTASSLNGTEALVTLQAGIVKQVPVNFFNTLFCTTVGYIVARTTGGWVCSSGIPINVTWFGADSTGVADSTTPIANAIAASQTTGSGAGSTGQARIYFPAGQYLASHITLNNGLDGQVISGDGPGATVLSWKANTPGTFVTAGAVGVIQTQALIEDLTIDGNGANQSSGNNNCLLIQSFQWVRVSNVSVLHCFKNGIVVQDGGNNNTGGILATNLIIDGWGTGGTGIGIQIANFMQQSAITNSVICCGPNGNDEAHAGIDILNNLNGVGIVNNQIFTNAPDVFLNNAVLTTIVGNTIGSNGVTSQAVVVSGSRWNQIANNSFNAFTGGTTLPLTLGAKGNLICGNVFVNSTGGGGPANGLTEDATSKPNNYCGPTPSAANQFVSGANAGATNFYSVNGPKVAAGTATITGCALNNGICTDSTDFAGSLTTSANTTSAALTFGSTWVKTPKCVVSLENDGSHSAVVSPVSTTALTIVISAAVSSDIIAYHCTGSQ